MISISGDAYHDLLLLGCAITAEHIPMHFPAVFSLFPDHHYLSFIEFIMVKVKQFIVAFFSDKVVPISVNMLDDKLAMHFRTVFEEVQDIILTAERGGIGRQQAGIICISG